MWEGIELLIGCSVCVQRAFTSGSTTFSDAAQSEEGIPVIGLESLRCRCYIAFGEVNVRRYFLVRVCCNLVGQSCSYAGADSLVGGADEATSNKKYSSRKDNVSGIALPGPR